MFSSFVNITGLCVYLENKAGTTRVCTMAEDRARALCSSREAFFTHRGDQECAGEARGVCVFMYTHVHQKEPLVRKLAGDSIERKRHQRVQVKHSSDLTAVRKIGK